MKNRIQELIYPVKSLLVVLTLVTMLNACSVKKQVYSHSEIIRDSTQITIDTSYHPKEVEFKIKSENDSSWGELHFSKDDFNRYIDSLFSVIDTTCNIEQISEVIINTRGLWTSDTSFLETSLAESQAVVYMGKLHHYLAQKDTTLRQRYDSLLQIIKHQRETWHSKEVTQSTEIVKRTGFNFKLIIIIVLVILIGWAILKRFI